MVATASTVSTKSEKSTCVRLTMPETTIKGRATRKSKLTRVTKRNGINLILPAPFKNRAKGKGFKARQRQGRFVLFILSLVIAALITMLIVMHNNFTQAIRKEIATIHKLSTEDDIPYSIMDDETTRIMDATILDAAEVTKNRGNKFGNLHATVDTATKVVTTIPVDVTTEKGSTVTEDATDVRQGVQDTERPSIQTIPENHEENQEKFFLGQEGEVLDEVDFHSHEQMDKMIDYLKLDVVFKIYTYIYAFYISVTLLIMLQILIIIRLLSYR